MTFFADSRSKRLDGTERRSDDENPTLETANKFFSGENLECKKWKTAELIFTGNELLNGNVLNTNSQWIAETLTSLGIQVKRMEVVEDNIAVIAGTLKESLERHPDLIIMSGGLGPTYDDVTLEGMAKALGKPLQVNPEALNMIRDRYTLAEKAGLLRVKDSEKNMIKMASLPADASPLTNPVGAAPGVAFEQARTTIFSVPGVPAEMKAIFNFSIISWIKAHLGMAFHAGRTLLVAGVAESRIAPSIVEAMSKVSDTWIKSCVQGAGRSEICISTTAATQDEATRRIKEASRMITDSVKVLGGSVEVKEDE